LLGDRLSVTDGVEVRARAVAARSDDVSDPDSGQPGVTFTLYAADGTVLDERTSSQATTLVGFDDGLGGKIASMRLRARLHIGGALEVGGMGAGHWELRVGSDVFEYDLAVSGSGFGEEVLAPPARTTRLESDPGEVVEAQVTLASSDETGAHKALSGGGLFGLIARPAPRAQMEVIADA